MRSVHEITSAMASASSDAVASKAFEELYDAKFDLMHTLIRRRFGMDEATALDLVQDSMMRVMRHIQPMQSEADLDAWLTRVTLSCVFDHLRKERRRRAREAIAGAVRAGSVGDLHALDERIEALRAELLSMRLATFDLLAMRFRAGMTLEAIGRRLGIGPGAVDGRIRRALASLGKGLEERHDASE